MILDPEVPQCVYIHVGYNNYHCFTVYIRGCVKPLETINLYIKNIVFNNNERLKQYTNCCEVYSPTRLPRLISFFR